MSSTVQVSPEQQERSERIVWAEDDFGCASIVVPQATVASWCGHNGEDGEYTEDSHAMRAGFSTGVVELDGLRFFSFNEEALTGFLEEAGGGLFLRWVGADTAAGLLAAAEANAFAPLEGTDGRFTVPEGGLVHMVLGADGRSVELGAPVLDGSQLMAAAHRLPLAPGEYEVLELRTDEGSPEWSGEVAHSDGGTEEVMVQAYRLRRSASPSPESEGPGVAVEEKRQERDVHQ